jgi:glycosyltransferase involved in cell wall biosynthesis
MKICLVSQQYPPDTARGGIGTQTWNKATTLARLGHTVHVLSRANGATASTSIEVDGRLTVHRMPVDASAPGETYEESVYWVRYAWAVHEALQRLMDAHSFDVINFPEWGAEGFAYLVNRPRGDHAPTVVHLHGPLSMFGERMGWPDRTSMLYRLGTVMEDTSIELADALMASSAHIAEYVADRHGLSPSRIDVVHSGIDCDLFRPPAADARPARRPTVLFVGNIARNKGVTFLVDAVLRMRQRFPDLRLRVVGGGGAELVEQIRRRARQAGAPDAIEICGFVPRERLPEFYGEADVFASPTEYEMGVANVYIEAMACGCPVVAGTAGGASEAVHDGETGVLVPPGDVDALVEALTQILGDAALRRRMSLAGRRRVEDYFALDRYIARVLATYARAIDRVRVSSGV